MPDIKWEEIDEIIHKCKNTLQIAYGMEKMCRRLRETLSEELDKINQIILQQVENGRNNNTMDSIPKID